MGYLRILKRNHIVTIFLLLAMVLAYFFMDAPLPESAKADRVIIVKSHHTLTLMNGNTVLKIYHVALGRGGLGPKLQQRDNRVPEGAYHIAGRDAQSQFHLALRISYPEPRDVEAAHERNVSPGGDIMIHGIHNGLG